jgi:hypothetical protein
MRRVFLIATTWPFILSLIALILNDSWLKQMYPGMITGKLSDFAGLAVVGLILLSIWPNRSVAVCCTLSAVFLWWKSPASEPAIQFVNTLLFCQIGRTVDYSDLLALAILPVCQHIVSYHRNYVLPWPGVRRLLMPPLVMATLFGIMATSVVPTRQEYVIKSADSMSPLNCEAVAEVIKTVAKKHDLSCISCKCTSGTYRGNNTEMRYTFLDGAISFHIQSFNPSPFYGASSEKKVNALNDSLKKALGEQFQGLEYVEQLNYPE